MLKNFCAFITFVERESAEEAMKALHNKLAIKVIFLKNNFLLQDEKYRLSWAKISDPDFLEEENQEKTNTQPKNENLEKEYKTECPLYDTDKIIPLVTPINVHGDRPKYLYSLNLNNYDKGVKPYYPSMDPNAMGGELQYKSKKKMKAITKEKEKNNNNLSKLLQVYEDV